MVASAPWPGRSCLLLILSLLAPLGAHGQAMEVSREYRIKAAYLYNLLRFITWPPGTQPADHPINICVYGFNPFDRYLEQLQERTVEGRGIKISYIPEDRQGTGCDMLFISQYNTTEPTLLRQEEPLPPVLTVGDGDNFVRRGGMVGLVTVGNNIQLDINRTRGIAAGFQFSANLLEVARTVR